jgi:hypothetical protein
MIVNPNVEIQLDASCPRKTDCAQNHQVGLVQTVLSTTVDARYTHTHLTVTPPRPARDAAHGVPEPFLIGPTPFAADRDKKNNPFNDTPSRDFDWIDPRSGAPAPPPAKNQQLRTATRAGTYTTWLVVQNIEWAKHDMAGSLAFLGNFNWGMSMTVQVTGKTWTPQTADPTVPATFSPGKGSGTPVLTGTIANDSLVDPAFLHMDPAPEL